MTGKTTIGLIIIIAVGLSALTLLVLFGGTKESPAPTPTPTWNGQTHSGTTTYGWK